MRVLVALTCLLAACLAQAPQRCTSPPLMSGQLTAATQNEKLGVFIKYLYDAAGQRIRLIEQGFYEKKPFTSDYLLHYKEGVLYHIFDKTQTCQKMPLKGQFQPLGIPITASLLGQAVLGNASGPGEGLRVTTWIRNMTEKTGKLSSTVTDVGCFPVGTDYHTEQFGWVLLRYFNNVVGISDPSQLDPPHFCPNAETPPEGEHKDFLSLFLIKD